MVAIFQEILGLALDVAPWLLLGLLVAGLIKGLVPDSLLQRWVGGNGLGAIGRAAIIGAPLPLCSCGAIPTAITLHRNGAGRGPTTAFMVATPGIGADSVAVTYALLGPVMMLARLSAAFGSAVLTGLLVAAGQPGARRRQAAPRIHHHDHAAPHCDSGCAHPGAVPAAAHAQRGLPARLLTGLRYAFDDLLGDIGGWIAGGLVLAGLLVWAVPPQAFASYLSGLPAMLLMAVIGIPIYLCATAATPIGVAMLLAGASPGAVLVFLLAGPITSLATLAVLRREMGNAALARYLAGVISTSILAGLMLEQAIGWSGLDVIATMGTTQDLFPAWAEWGALALLLGLGLRPAGRRLLRLA